MEGKLHPLAFWNSEGVVAVCLFVVLVGKVVAGEQDTLRWGLLQRVMLIFEHAIGKGYEWMHEGILYFGATTYSNFFSISTHKMSAAISFLSRLFSFS